MGEHSGDAFRCDSAEADVGVGIVPVEVRRLLTIARLFTVARARIPSWRTASDPNNRGRDTAKRGCNWLRYN